MTPGHAVVIPKIHANNIIELSESATSSLFIAVKKVASLLKERLESLGFTIGINHGSLSGQTVDHIHVHITPRYTGDGGKSIHSVAHLSSNEPLSKIREKIIGE
jgi:histidine triad (HIT) family protein